MKNLLNMTVRDYQQLVLAILFKKQSKKIKTQQAQSLNFKKYTSFLSPCFVMLFFLYNFQYPTTMPTKMPTVSQPTQNPSVNPTQGPTVLPSVSPSFGPTMSPTLSDRIIWNTFVNYDIISIGNEQNRIDNAVTLIANDFGIGEEFVTYNMYYEVEGHFEGSVIGSSDPEFLECFATAIATVIFLFF